MRPSSEAQSRVLTAWNLERVITILPSAGTRIAGPGEQFGQPVAFVRWKCVVEDGGEWFEQIGVRRLL